MLVARQARYHGHAPAQHAGDPAPLMFGRPGTERQAGQDRRGVRPAERPEDLGVVHHLQGAEELGLAGERPPHSSEGTRVGKEWVRACSYRWAPGNSKQTTPNTRNKNI